MIGQSAMNNLNDRKRVEAPDDFSLPRQFMPEERVAILLFFAVDKLYDYAVPAKMMLTVGDIVQVPFGHRTMYGVVWQQGQTDSALTRIKYITDILPLPSFRLPLLQFIKWVADYTLQPLGAVLQLVARDPSVLLGHSEEKVLSCEGNLPKKFAITQPRKRVLSSIAKGVFNSFTDLSEDANVSASVITSMIKCGVIKIEHTAIKDLFETPDTGRRHLILEKEQAIAAKALCELLKTKFSVSLLEGVTGSGKTEVYFEPLAAALDEGKQVLVLVPEITLTIQWFNRFRERFGCVPAIWHSNLSKKTRKQTWLAIANGDARVVIGARSALFLPYANLGLIIVDEEHDSSFKQEDGVIYNARDMSVVRGRAESASVVLVSATPSLETLTNVASGKYKHSILKQRVGTSVLPKIALIDMLKNPPIRGDWGKSWLSPPLVSSIDEALAHGDQSLLFLNRRGYAPLTLCAQCGYRVECNNCSAWLVQHGAARYLQCHHCGSKSSPLLECPSCNAKETMVACGPGIERIAEEVKARWPEANIVIADSESLSKDQAVRQLVEKISSGATDIIIGTQILAKGHHFPNLTLVGVIDADIGLSSWDLRASERTHQLLHQVSGRAGREEKAGSVLIQTREVQNPVMQSLVMLDSRSFVELEKQSRQILKMPPFGRLVSIIVSGKKEESVVKVVNDLSHISPIIAGVEFLGPAPAFISMLRGKYRYRLLVRGPQNYLLQNDIRRWVGKIVVPSSVKIQIDVDPYNFY